MAKQVPFLSSLKRQQSKRLYHTIVLLGAGAFFYLFVVLVHPFFGLNQVLTDKLFRLEKPPENIVIVGIDNDTLAIYGRLAEWPRRLHAQSVGNLSQAGARVIGFDVLFIDDSPDDAILAAAMKQAARVVLPTVLVGPGQGAISSGTTPARVMNPTPLLQQAAGRTGYVNITPDADGVVRRIPLLLKDSSGESHPAFAVTMLHALFSLPPPQSSPMQTNSLLVAGRSVPVDDFYRLRINYGIHLDQFPYLSYSKIVNGDFDPATVRNRIVLVGMTATGDIDSWPVPGAIMRVPGVLVHAATMDTILRQRFLKEVSMANTERILLLILAVNAVVLPLVRLRWRAVIIGGFLLSYLVFTVVAFDRGYIFNIVYPLTEFSFIFMGTLMFQVGSEQSDRRFVQGLFGRYVSPQVAGKILDLAQGNNLRLGGERREVTVLFADVRGFTQMSEKMDPEAMVNTLNTYFSIIIERVLENNGMVNKFAGDNIMAVWNAPQDEPQHARLAIKAALESQALILLAQEKDPSLPKIKFGFGINSGEALAGNIGSSGRAEYTVIGDAVNLASRICSATPGGEVWAGSRTFEQAKDHLEACEAGQHVFKGKTEKELVYRMVNCR